MSNKAKHTKRLMIRLTEDEIKVLAEDAAEMGHTPASYARWLVVFGLRNKPVTIGRHPGWEEC